MSKFLKFLHAVAFPMALIPWSLFYSVFSRIVFGKDPNTTIGVALVVLQLSFLVIQIGFTIQAYLEYRAMKKRVAKLMGDRREL